MPQTNVDEILIRCIKFSNIIISSYNADLHLLQQALSFIVMS